MSESGYTEIDLDSTKASLADDVEIVEEETETPVVETPPEKPAPQAEAEDDDDGGEDEGEGPKKRLTRNQRLKAQRDSWAARARELEAKQAEAEAKLARYETDATEGAGVALDMYIKSIDEGIRAARGDFDKAFDSGDRDALFQANLKVAELMAEKKAAEGERRRIPQKGQQSGGEARQPTQTTTENTPSPARPTGGKGPSRAALEWHKENPWFGTDKTMTVVARQVDADMVSEGFEPDDPEYFDELTKRVRAELPHKFAEGGVVNGVSRTKPKSPVIQTQSSPAANGGKIKVTLTAEDKRIAASMGVPLERYAKQKYLREQAEKTTNGYTEIA